MNVLRVMAGVWVLLGLTAQAGIERFGAGVMLGEPTGISMKAWLSETRALDGGVGWSFTENDSLHLHADYLWHNFDLLFTPEPGFTLPLFFGVGARVKLEESGDDHADARNHEDTLVGIRAPIGMSLLPASRAYDLFAEIVPTVDVVPDVAFDIGAAVGLRAYFP